VNNIQLTDIKSNVLWLGQMRPGERLLVEVIKGNQSGLATILLKDRYVQAEIEAFVQAGERFFAIVGEKQAEGILLVRADRPPEQAASALPGNPEQAAKQSAEGTLIKVLPRETPPNRSEILKPAAVPTRLEGERTLVEVIKGNQSGLALVLAKGQYVQAKIDVPVQAGERFFAVLTEQNAEGIMFLKKADIAAAPLPEAPEGAERPADRLNAQVLQRGILTNDREILRLVQQLPERGGDWQVWRETIRTAEPLKQLLAYLEIPEWPEMETEGMEKIVKFLQKMGIEYEAKLLYQAPVQRQEAELGQQPGQQPLREPGELARAAAETLNPAVAPKPKEGQELKIPRHAAEVMGAAAADGPEEPEAVKETLKGAVLKELAALAARNSEPPHHRVLTQMLDHITSQQLWLQSGAAENAFFLLCLPLRNQGEMNEVRIAAEAKRKGTKLDVQHCRLAFLTSTEYLGEIGIDAWLGSEGIDVKILSADPEELTGLLDEAWPDARHRITNQGWPVKSMAVSRLESDSEFMRFIQGNKRSGVDLQG
jgi:hypothetical protein